MVALVTDRESWLAARRNGIGSSDAAAILGVCPYKTPLGVYLDKIGEAPPTPETPAMRRGLLLEDDILNEAESLLGCGPLRRQAFTRHPERPWQIATVDGLSHDGLIVEAKVVGMRQAWQWGEPGTDEVPDGYLVQVQHQLAVTGGQEAVIAALIGGSDLHIYRLTRNDRLIARMTEMEAGFWSGVIDRVPPPPTDPSDAEIVSYLHPPTEAAVELPPNVAEIVGRYTAYGKQAAEADRLRGLARAELLAALAGAGRGTLPDGREVRQKAVTVKEHLVKASEYVRLTIKERKG